MKHSTTYEHARRLGVGGDLTDGHDRFMVSDWSPHTGQVYGWRLKDTGERGAYGQLPEGLEETK